ncbi:hypothetical protein [Frankia sp. CiP3]|uniref:hypothetical protein n=1 Tax=Frankia sp. CiP3 TaxID=2880971 RepID=UPI001EF678E0|nr:hypothetical protein [Frankia sp. CiP3]
MVLPLHDRILDSIEAYFGLSPQMLTLSVEVSQPELDQRVIRLSLKAARERVADPAVPAGIKDAIWSALVRLASEAKDPWDTAVIWMMVPGLRRICRRCRRYGSPLDSSELESEAVAGFVEVLHVADPNRPALGSWLWWTTYRHVQEASARARAETPTADIELLGSLRAYGYDDSTSSQTVVRLVRDDVPVVDESAAAGSALEGERLGALAHRLGLDRALHLPGGSTERAA